MLPETTLIYIGAVGFIVLAVIGLLVFALRRRGNKQAQGGSSAQSDVAPNAAISPTQARSAAPPVSSPDTGVQATPTKSVSSEVPRSEPNQVEEKPKIRILVVDDNRDTTENVSRLLYFEDDMEVIGQAYTGRQGVEAATKTRPHIVLMDINMPDMDGITATEKMRTVAPYSQVIIISVQADPQYMKQALAAGARDFQPKPFSADELVSCIRHVYQIGLPMYQHMDSIAETIDRPTIVGDTEEKASSLIKDAPVVAVYSPKGGVGASAIATNLAVVWQKALGDTILMDGDLQFGDVMVHLNVIPHHTIHKLTEADQIDADILSQVLIPHQSGLKLLLAPPSPELADMVTQDMIKQIIHLLKKECRLIVIDTSSVLTNQMLTILDTVDYLVVVVNPQLPAIKSTKLFLELLHKLKYPFEHVCVVVNQANMPGGIPPEQIKKVLKLNHLQYLPDDPKLYQATNRGQSIFEQHGDSPVAKEFTRLAKNVWQSISKLAAPPSNHTDTT